MEEVNAPEAESPEVEAAELEPGETSPEEDSLLIAEAVADEPQVEESSVALKAIVEAAIFITDEPLSPEQIALALEQPLPRVKEVLNQLAAEYSAPDCGLSVREVAGGYKLATKPEFHDSIRRFVKKLQPPLKLSLAALETLAVIAYKEPITGPEILDIRGVQGAGVLKTLLDRKLIATAGRKNVIGKPIMYKTTREFLIQFGLNSLAELPTLKEFEELGRMALSDEDLAEGITGPAQAHLEIGGEASIEPLESSAEGQPEPENTESPAEPLDETAAENSAAEENEDHG